MGKSGTAAKPAIVRVQTGERATEIMALCQEKGIKVVVGIEPDEPENISDVEKIINNAGARPLLLKAPISKNGPCPCGSGKQYKRCCMN